MRFQPKSEDEINAANLLAGGDYDFEVFAASEEVSTKGNDMVKLTLHIEGEEGRRHTVFDYLVGSDASMFKVRGFAVCVGLLPQYEMGEMSAESMIGRTGRCQIGIDDKNKAYAPKNVVRMYHKPVNGTAAAPVAAKGSAPAMVDDDIPFAPEVR